MNHSSQFWSIVGQLTENVGQARDWLKLHGSGLHRYG
jgi:predicted metal-dependent hydrolase